MPDEIVAPDKSATISSKGLPEERFYSWMDDMTDLLNSMITIEGTGSPEGVVTASNGQRYFDTAADAEYYKKTGDGDTGWVAL